MKLNDTGAHTAQLDTVQRIAEIRARFAAIKPAPIRPARSVHAGRILQTLQTIRNAGRFISF